MDIKKLEIFLAAADMGSLTKAAAAYSYTPSGITHMINALESELGFPLLIRGKGGVQLTGNGARLVPIIRELLHWQEDFNQTVSEINGMTIGTLTIGSYSSIAVSWLPRVIKRFQADYPNIRIVLMEGIRQDIVGWLDERKVDIGFLSYNEGMKFGWIPLRDVPMVAVLPADHPLAGADRYPIERCASEAFIMPARGSDFDVVDLFEREGIRLKIKYETYDNSATLSMIEHGLGMSVMNELVAEVRACNVAKLPLKQEKHVTLGIAVPNSEKLSPAAEGFIAYARRILLPDHIA